MTKMCSMHENCNCLQFHDVTDSDIRHCVYSYLDVLLSNLILHTRRTFQSEKINDFQKLASAATVCKDSCWYREVTLGLLAIFAPTANKIRFNNE